ncbi:winged helix-turn-helix transcriptional regulator [uncultured Fibrella sp.]|uniref:winged helix-turn-helix transcriptional regulator n=1 Tax=uncultured Fibrella sp. TaxID=1284596 RepID=UPI0035CB8221
MTGTSDDRVELQAVQDALYVVGGKWRFAIIFALCDQPRRFNELQRQVKGITSRMLSKELRELELNKLVKRTVYATSPIVTEYELTRHGMTLEPVLKALGAWGKFHREEVVRPVSSPIEPVTEEDVNLLKAY